MRNGEFINFYKGTLFKKCCYKDGKLDGYYITYFEGTSIIHKKCNYKDGKLEGVYETYYPNKQINVRVDFKNGVRHGHYQTFYGNYGELVTKCIDKFYKNGKLYGPSLHFDPVGRIHEKKFYKNGELYWKYKKWCISTLNLIKKCFYVNNKLHGKYQEWDSNEKLIQEGFFIHGEEHGYQRGWNSYGKLIKENFYVYGIKSTSKKWHPGYLRYDKFVYLISTLYSGPYDLKAYPLEQYRQISLEKLKIVKEILFSKWNKKGTTITITNYWQLIPPELLDKISDFLLYKKKQRY